MASFEEPRGLQTSADKGIGTGEQEKNENQNDNYERYKVLGGTISEEEYKNVLLRKTVGGTMRPERIEQARVIAQAADIPVRDEVVALYAILRGDTTPLAARGKEHHSKKNDPEVFREALRMVGDIDSIRKLETAYPAVFFPANVATKIEPTGLQAKAELLASDRKRDTARSNL